MSRYVVYICGGNTAPPLERGSDCPDPLHDWPLPSGYTDASEEAERRIARGWGSRRCRQCGLYGWTIGRKTKGTTAEHWRPQTAESPCRAEASR